MVNPRLFRRVGLSALGVVISAVMLSLLAVPGHAQRNVRKAAGSNSGKVVVPNAKVQKTSARKRGDDEIKGVRLKTEPGIQRVNDEVMQSALYTPPAKRPEILPERERERDEDSKAENPDAPAVSQWPVRKRSEKLTETVEQKIHTLGAGFDGATLTDTGSFPPDSMGAAGPTQYIAFENGRIRTFNKTSGVADGVLNVNPDVFFASVITPVGGGVTLSFTSDPQVRYDRFTSRWILVIIDVPCTNAQCTTTAANRVLVAVSDAASNGTISGSTVWTFFQFKPSPTTDFCDYESLGVDVNALYIGCNMFSSAGSFVRTDGFVLQKSSVLGAGPIVATAFAGLAAGSGAGLWSPRGVDNYDAGATEGYFIGPDNASFSLLVMRRVSNPGSASPTISANLNITVPTTRYPDAVEHTGNTGGTNGRLDSLDDRLFQAMIRNGRLWTAHNLLLTSAGVATTTTATGRTGVRWYELNNLTTTPALVQSGTVYDNAATRAAALQYFIPSIVVTGQGHAVIGCTMAGNVGATPAFFGRLSGDTLGTMVGPPTVAAVTFGTTTGNYNPPSDPGPPRRWGDYSATMVDPLDDMTVWTVQQYNHASNSYAVRIGKLLAPPPPPLNTASPATVFANNPSQTIVVTGVAPAGQGFYDPGANLPAPARPFTHISASSPGLIVNSITYNSPTQVTLNVSTVGSTAGTKTITITNPDGQTTTVNVNISVLTAASASISGRVDGVPKKGLDRVSVELRSMDGMVLQTVQLGRNGTYTFAPVPTGSSYIIAPVSRRFSFSPESVVYQLVDEVNNINFTANGN